MLNSKRREKTKNLSKNIKKLREELKDKGDY